MNECVTTNERIHETSRRAGRDGTTDDARTGAVLSRVRVQNVREREIDDDTVDVPARGGDADDGTRGDDARERRGR
jgi:hypothetical protein